MESSGIRSSAHKRHSKINTVKRNSPPKNLTDVKEERIHYKGTDVFNKPRRSTQ